MAEREVAGEQSVLVVDDEIDIGFLMKVILNGAGHSVVHVEDLETARQELEKKKFDAIFLDLNLNGEWGLDLVSDIRARNRKAKIAVITALKSSRTQKKLDEENIDTVIQKPFNRTQILEVLSQ